MAMTIPAPRAGFEGDEPARLEEILAGFEEAWRSGLAPIPEDWIGRLDPDRPADATELIYAAFLLAEADGLSPDPGAYLARFPEHGRALGRLFELHALASSADFVGPEPAAELPEVGDEIGPYRLVRELGRGGFARVFLAEQEDLDGRHVVVKVTARPSPEPRLLARSRHAHIVEVLSTGTTGDGALQVICMPFLGGATLAAVNAAGGPRPASGRDLLGRLDRVSAAEYPASGQPRPARELIARLSYPRAVAWIFARLAEALDHAHDRGVGHGDVKPSNILITADGVPMLFDFNLAVDRRGDAAGRPSGGTLAYMPPERLRALAGGPAEPFDLLRADLYGLGLVLVETLTGVAPTVPASTDGRDGVARALAEARSGGVTAFPGWAALGIPAGLRMILEKCLAVAPADRFADGRELAGDLDRWREHRAPAVARDVAWPSRAARWARRRRVPLAATLFALVGAAVAGVVASVAHRAALRDEARAKYDRFLDKDDAGLFGFRPFASWSPRGGDPADSASRKLNHYGIVDDAAWRSRGDVAALDGPDRDDLELLMVEQAYRLARAWAARPGSEGDWRRALTLVDRERSAVPAQALEALGDELRARPALAGVARPRPAGPPPPAWVEAYLLGVAAEPLHAREAMGHFERAAAERPELIWPRYRAASAGWRIGKYESAAEHLRAALARRPNNPALHTHLATMLLLADRPREASVECDLALALDPDFAEAYRNRALIDDHLRRDWLRRRDGDRFALLTAFLGPGRRDWLDLQSLIFAALRGRGGDPVRRDELLAKAIADDPSDTDLRVHEANRLAREGKTAEAVAVLDAVLREQPDHLAARYNRATYLRRLGRPEALAEYTTVAADPRIEELYREQPGAILTFGVLTNDLIRLGRLDEALAAARRGLEESERTGHYRADAHYTLARALAANAGPDPAQLDPARERLRIAVGLKPALVTSYAKDRLFADLRRSDPSFLRPTAAAPIP